MWLVAGSNALRRFKTDAFLSLKKHFLHLLLDCNLFEMNISYGFLNKFTMPTAFCAVDRNLKHGCGKTLVVDGNKKNHDNGCLAGNAGYAEYIQGRV